MLLFDWVILRLRCVRVLMGFPLRLGLGVDGALVGDGDFQPCNCNGCRKGSAPVVLDSPYKLEVWVLASTQIFSLKS